MNIASPPPLCGYRRLSVDRHGNKIGYEIQTSDSEAWAVSAGHVIGHWYEDRNETAADEDVFREGFEEMLTDLANGIWGGVAVWRIDRLTRLMPQFEQCFTLVRRRGGFIVATKENLTTLTQNGINMLRLQVMMGENEVYSTKTRIRANKSEKAKRGHYTGGGRRPYGFQPPLYDGEGRVLNSGHIGVTHVPGEVENLQEAARRIAWEGESYLEVINDWHSREVPIYGATGAPWNTKTLQSILASPRMIGMQEYTDAATGERTLTKAVWLPVLDERTWNRLVSLQSRREKPYGMRGKYLLTNIAECGSCGRPASGCQRTYERGGVRQPVRTYRCPSTTPYRARGSCGKLSVLADPVEKIVVTHVLVRLERTRGFLQAVDESADEGLFDTLSDLERKVEECRGQLDELAVAFARRKIRMSQLEAAQEIIEQELTSHEAKMRSLAAQLAVPKPVGADFDDLRRWFEGLSFRQQRAVIEANVKRVVVLLPGRGGRYFRPERVQITLAGPEVAGVESE